MFSDCKHFRTEGYDPYVNDRQYQQKTNLTFSEEGMRECCGVENVPDSVSYLA